MEGNDSDIIVLFWVSVGRALVSPDGGVALPVVGCTMATSRALRALARRQNLGWRDQVTPLAAEVYVLDGNVLTVRAWGAAGRGRSTRRSASSCLPAGPTHGGSLARCRWHRELS